MIASLRGVVQLVTETGVVVDVHGVGYDVVLPASTRAALPPPGSEVQLTVLTQVREDAITLVGFGSLEEKELYLALISVSQIGPKLALAILGNIPPDELYDAIALGDTKRLSMVPGVGKKSAARMVLELRDKLPAVASRPLATPAAEPGDGGAAPARSAREDLVDALQSLGFRPAEITGVLRDLRPSADEPIDELMRRALAMLAAGR